MLKKLRRQLSRFAPALIYQLARTWRIRVAGDMPEGPAVVAFWHGEMLPVWKNFAATDAFSLISLSRDGSLYSDLSLRWGYEPIRGSSSKGGAEAFSNIVNVLKSGKKVFMTPDGPRGPRHVMKSGAIFAAKRAKVPLVLCRISASPAIHGTRWDLFEVPVPFAKIELELITLDLPENPDRAALERLNTYAENLLNKVTPLL